MTIGDLIKRYCDNAGISAREFARRAEMSNGYVSELVRGVAHGERGTVSVPSLDVMIRISNVIGIPLNDLLKMIDKDTVISLKPAAVSIPVLGTVRAGLPLEACENIIDYEEISPTLQGEYFGLRIKGDSMEPRIFEGDVVIVKKTNAIDSGDVAIVLVNGNEATCKKVIKSKDSITLIGFNPTFTPITYSKNEINTLPVQIIGKVIEIRAKL